MDGAFDLPPELGARVLGPVSAGKDAGAPEPPMAGQRGATFESVIWKSPACSTAGESRAVPSGGRNYRARARAARGAGPLQSGLLREIHLGRLGRARRLQLEVLPRSLAEHLGREHLREAPDVGVVAVHGFVVVLPRHGDAVLRPLELVLQRAEVLVGLELRVVLGH